MILQSSQESNGRNMARKNKFATFTQRHKGERNPTPISYNGTIIQESNTIKYLGLILHNKLTFKKP